MEVSRDCDLEVDVNGEEIFMVNQRILASFSGRLRKIEKSDCSKKNLKVIFCDFPGGPEGFDLFARFCYSSSRIAITQSNTVLLNCVCRFMEMDLNVLGKLNLVEKIEMPFEEIGSWTWSELLLALKRSQDVINGSDSSIFIEKILGCLIERLIFVGSASPCTSFSENSSSFRVSCDTNSSNSMKQSYSPQRTMWWFEDLLFFNLDLVQKVIKMLIPNNFDHETISKFLFSYQKSRFRSATQAQRRETTEVVIDLLCLLDRRSLSWKGVFGILQAASTLDISKIYKNKLEILLGSQLDQAKIDHLLAPSPPGKDYAYDVSLVIRLVKAFLSEKHSFFSMKRVQKVACLVDSYVAEVSADFRLYPSKFVELLRVLPDFARQSHNQLYQAIDMYLEVHTKLCDEDKMRICSTLNYVKLSTDAMKHAAQNPKLPSKLAIKHLSLLQNTHQMLTFGNDKAHGFEEILVYSEDNHKSEAHQWRRRLRIKVMEVENLCRVKQPEKSSIYLPKLCS